MEFGIIGISYTKPLVESKQLRKKNFRRICDVSKKITGLAARLYVANGHNEENKGLLFCVLDWHDRWHRDSAFHHEYQAVNLLSQMETLLQVKRGIILTWCTVHLQLQCYLHIRDNHWTKRSLLFGVPPKWLKGVYAHYWNLFLAMSRLIWLKYESLLKMEWAESPAFHDPSF